MIHGILSVQQIKTANCYLFGSMQSTLQLRQECESEGKTYCPEQLRDNMTPIDDILKYGKKEYSDEKKNTSGPTCLRCSRIISVRGGDLICRS